MTNTTLPQTDALLTLLVQQVDSNRAELINCYQQILRETLFSNRAEVRPNILNNIAAGEAESLRNFLSKPEFSGREHGDQLYQTGLGENVVLRLGQVTRQFFLTHLECDQIAPMLETIHAYQEAVVQGFIQSLEKKHLTELERIRNALQGGSNQNRL